MAFLSEDAPGQTDSRKLMLATKQFLLSKDFVSALDGLEREKGAPIWQGFKPVVELREGAATEYVIELQRAHQRFSQETIPNLQRSLVSRSDEVKLELGRLIDHEIDVRADAGPEGLIQSCELLETMTDPAIGLRADVLGEAPQNLITSQRELAGHLDQRLGVSVDNTETLSLFNTMHGLRSKLLAFQTTLRLAAPSPIRKEEAEGTSDSNKRNASQEQNNGNDDSETGEQKELLQHDIEKIEIQISDAQGDYQRALIEEDRRSNQARFEATQTVKDSKLQTVAECENQLLTSDVRLKEAQQILNELQQERRQFLMTNLVIKPLVAVALLVGVPILLSLAGFE